MGNKNKILKILIGIPASGKSTWSSDYVLKNPNWVRVSRDDYRYMLKNQGFCEPKIESLINNLVFNTIEHSLGSNLNVIYDATNLKISYVQEFIDKFNTLCDIEFQLFDISLPKAIERDSNRLKSVGEEVINKCYKQYLTFIDAFDFSYRKQKRYIPIDPIIGEDNDAIIFDIDGTLALMYNRFAYDWDKVGQDKPNDIVIEQAKYHKSLGRKIIITSGRDEVCRKETIDWLKRYEIPFDELFMREKDSHEKDSIVKRRIFHELIEPHYNVIAVYDDRLQVVDMWYEEQLFVFNVNQGNRIF